MPLILCTSFWLRHEEMRIEQLLFQFHFNSVEHV